MLGDNKNVFRFLFVVQNNVTGRSNPAARSDRRTATNVDIDIFDGK